MSPTESSRTRKLSGVRAGVRSAGMGNAFRALVVLLSLILAGCATEGDNVASEPTSTESEPGGAGGETDAWQEVVDAAKAEGALTIYTVKSESVIEPLIEAFGEHYPEIEVEYFRTGTAAVRDRVGAQLAAGSVEGDVIWTADVAWTHGLAEEGEITPPSGPSAESWPAEHMENGVVVASIDPYGFNYNTEIVSPAPEGWCDLQEYPGGFIPISTANPAEEIIVIEELCGEEFFTNVADAGVQIAESVAAHVQAVAAGELAWHLSGLNFMVNPLAAEGAPVELVYPDSDVIGVVWPLSVLAQAPHHNAALLFVDFVMSPEGQEIANGQEALPALSVLDGIPGTLDIDMGSLRIPDWREQAESVARAKEIVGPYIPQLR